MSADENFDDLLEVGYLRAKNLVRAPDGKNRVDQLGEILAQVCDLANRGSSSSGELEFSQGIWYKMVFFCSRLEILLDEITEESLSDEVADLKMRIQDVRLASEARWRNLRIERNYLTLGDR